MSAVLQKWNRNKVSLLQIRRCRYPPFYNTRVMPSCFSFFIHFIFVAVVHDAAYLLVAEAHLFGFAQQIYRAMYPVLYFAISFSMFTDLLYLVKEPAVNALVAFEMVLQKHPPSVHL